MLAIWYRDGETGLRIDVRKAATLLLLAVKQGHGDSFIRLAEAKKARESTEVLAKKNEAGSVVLQMLSIVWEAFTRRD